MSTVMEKIIKIYKESQNHSFKSIPAVAFITFTFFYKNIYMFIKSVL